MELGNHVWRYAIRRGDDDPARAEFVEQVEARRRAESSQARRRQAARKATEALRAKLRAAGIDPHTYFSMLAQRGNAARWHKQDAAPQDVEHGARADAAPPQASQAHAQAQTEAGQAQAVAGAQVPQAIATGVHRPGELPAHLL